MDDSVIANARAELTRLQGERSRIANEIQKIEDFMQLYAKFSGEQTKFDVASGVLQPTMRISRRPSPELIEAARSAMARLNSKRDQIVDAAKEFLADGKKIPTRPLLDLIKGKGIEIGGNDEAANLSAYLSREKEIFQSDRIYGWSLKEKDSESVRAQSEPDIADLL